MSGKDTGKWLSTRKSKRGSWGPDAATPVEHEAGSSSQSQGTVPYDKDGKAVPTSALLQNPNYEAPTPQLTKRYTHAIVYQANMVRGQRFWSCHTSFIISDYAQLEVRWTSLARTKQNLGGSFTNKKIVRWFAKAEQGK